MIARAIVNRVTVAAAVASVATAAIIALIVSIHQRTVAVPQTTTTTTIPLISALVLASIIIAYVVHLVVLIMITMKISLESVKCYMSMVQATARSLVILIVLTILATTTVVTVTIMHCIQSSGRKSYRFLWPRSGLFDSIYLSFLSIRSRTSYFLESNANCRLFVICFNQNFNRYMLLPQTTTNSHMWWIGWTIPQIQYLARSKFIVLRIRYSDKRRESIR